MTSEISAYSRPGKLHAPKSSQGLSFGILSALDPEQRKAAEILTGQIRLSGGPGTGKTRTMTHRIAHLVTSKTTRPESCLVLLRTPWACQEMKDALERLIGKKAQNISILTWQGVGETILKESFKQAGLPKQFRLADASERLDFVRKALNWSKERAQTALAQLSHSKRESLMESAGTDSAIIKALLDEWRSHKGWLDEEDFSVLSLTVFENFPEIAAVYRKRFQYISIDEYQDLSAMDFGLIRCLIGPDGNICVSGDPRQSICGEAAVNYFERFKKDFPFAHQIHLTRNYRLGEALLCTAKLLSPEVLSSAVSLTADEGCVRVESFASDRAEAEYIAVNIRKLLQGPEGQESRRVPSYKPSDIAVIYRLEAQTDVLRDAFTAQGLEVKRGGAAGFEIKSDEKEASISLFLLNEVKGREFSVVFVAGCEESLIPEETMRSRGEEEGLFYVSLTRARERLILTYALKRSLSGSVLERKISPSLKSISRRVNYRERSGDQTNAPGAQLDLF